MARGYPLTIDQIDHMWKLHRKGMNRSAISRETGISLGTVSQNLRKLGAPKLKVPRQFTRRSQNNVSGLDIDDVLDDLEELG